MNCVSCGLHDTHHARNCPDKVVRVRFEGRARSGDDARAMRGFLRRADHEIKVQVYQPLPSPEVLRSIAALMAPGDDAHAIADRMIRAAIAGSRAGQL